MATVERFEELETWQLARQLYVKIIPIADVIRSKREYRFAEQMKSASGSIMDNIAEGFDRCSRKEFINSLGIANGECGEVRSQLYRALDDKYISEELFSEVIKLAEKVGAKIGKLIIYLNGSGHAGLKFKGRI
jgi:four helix bundle protein